MTASTWSMHGHLSGQLVDQQAAQELGSGRASVASPVILSRLRGTAAQSVNRVQGRPRGSGAWFELQQEQGPGSC